jgi:Domain of unknown function (DUF5134)
MTGPAWIAAIFGVIMIVTAIASLLWMIVAWRTCTATDFEIDGHNVLMGVSMAGMLIPGLLFVTAGPSTTIWLVVWILITAWFGISVIRGAANSTGGHRFTGHRIPHLIMSGAMIYMFAVATRGGIGSGPSMVGMASMSSGGALVPFPTLDYAFVIFMIGYAVLVIDRLPRLAIVGVGDRLVADQRNGMAGVSRLAPSSAALVNIAMAITMGYMLTTMFV